MQPAENSDQIFIVVIDETYQPEDEDAWETKSEQYRIYLELKFGAQFDELNVGSSAEVPAFITILTNIPLWSVMFGAFFLGKQINENLEAWAEIGRKIKSFFEKPVLLARHGAAVIAVEAVFAEMGGMPKTVQLLSYRPAHIGESDDLESIAPSEEIHESPPTHNLAFVRHIFEIEADGQRLRVSVDGKNSKVLRI